ncbi:RNA-binding protein [Candidatus Woesearchaeota archaeon]|nr:RNA-binding protein [Candidatus Woesearchaeota archaeon]
MAKEKIHIKNRDIVVPGDLLAEGMAYLPSGKAFREDNKIYAATVGLISIKGRVIKVIPLAGKYMPKKGDVVIGRVTNMGYSGWHLDVNSPYNADLNIGEATREYIDLAKTDLSKYFDIGEYALAEVINISENKYIKLSTKKRPYRKLKGGNIIEVSPTKIPRIIGKAGSMIKMLKDSSGCDIIVGQNGIVWIKGTPEKEALVAQAIHRIEKESHTKGLTYNIKKMLGGKKK